jgi:hypothetical protein
MSQAIKEKSVYADAFREFSTSATEGEPSWLARVREGAFERFEELGFPTTDAEDWKYTNVSTLTRGTFRPASEEQSNRLDADAVASFIYEEARRSCFRPRLRARG